MIHQIKKPSLIVIADRVVKNIRRMAEKARKSGTDFRPHFKTHQSAEIGELFREEGVEKITVSSVEMAMFFAENGWKDITIAFPVNILEIDDINKLASGIKLNLLLESVDTVDFLNSHLLSPCEVWIKIDCGYKRTGILFNDRDRIKSILSAIQKSDKLKPAGLLTHSGHSYKAKSEEEIINIWNLTSDRMRSAKESLGSEYSGFKISVGDTPCCSVVADLSGVDEIRPGNFIYYDAMQLSHGICAEEDIAAAVYCPVVAKHEERNEIVIYGGAVHLSKDSFTEGGVANYGYIAPVTENGWSSIEKHCHISSLSQEHGIVRVSDAFMKATSVGSLIAVIPAHSCLTADLLRRSTVILSNQNESIKIVSPAKLLSIKECGDFFEYFLPKLLNEGFMKPLLDFPGGNRTATGMAVRSLCESLMDGKSFQQSIRDMSPSFPLPVEELMITGFEKSILDKAIAEMLEILRSNSDDEELLRRAGMLSDRFAKSPSGGMICGPCIVAEVEKIWERAALEGASDVFIEQEGELFFRQKYAGVKMVHIIEPSHSMVYNSLRGFLAEASKSENKILICGNECSVSKNGKDRFRIAGGKRELNVTFSFPG